jgi:hypothetical protein
MPIELHRAVDVAVVDEQLGRRPIAGRCLDRILQRIGLEVAAVDRSNLRSDRDAGVERGAVPQHARHLAVHADDQAAGVGEIAVLASLLRALDPFGRFGGVDERVAALVNAL